MSAASHNKKQGSAITGHVPDFSKSPFVIEKVERAHALVARYGLPKQDKPKKGK